MSLTSWSVISSNCILARPSVGLLLALVGLLVRSAEAGPAVQTVMNSQPVNPYDMSETLLLDYVKMKILEGLGMQGAPRLVKRDALEDASYDRIYEEYQRRLKEDQLLDDDVQEDAGNSIKLERLHTVRPVGNGSPSLEVNQGVTSRIFHLDYITPSVTYEGLVSAKLRFRFPRKSHHSPCSVQIYKVDDGLKYLVADFRKVSGKMRRREGRSRRVLDLTSAVKGWLRKENAESSTINLEMVESQRGCVRELPVFDFMVKDESSLGNGRSKRSIRRRIDPSQTLLVSKASKKVCTGDKDKSCCMRSLNVTFADLGWDWIIEPKSFQANFCRGQCLYKHGNFATTHAMLQSRVSRIFGHKVVPRPCCSPRKLKPLPVMYKDSRNNTHFGRIPKMVVQECACS